MMRCVLAILIICLCAVSARADWLFRPVDHGGPILERLVEINEARKAGVPHRIEGDCESSCTLWLSYERACIEPDAMLWFHAAYSPGKIVDGSANAVALNVYPRKVRNVIRNWLHTPEFTPDHTLTGRDLIGLGIRACN
jgi:hypothetical protein